MYTILYEDTNKSRNRLEKIRFRLSLPYSDWEDKDGPYYL